MRNLKNNEFFDRRSAAADAKAALIQAYRAAKEAAEPTREARQAERLAMAETRELRRAEREQAKLDGQKRVEKEMAAQNAVISAATLEAAERAEIETRGLAAKHRIARVVADELARQAERDRRYANQKVHRA